MQDKTISYESKLDLRGLLVRDVGFDSNNGGSIDGVYELSKIIA